MESPLTAKWLCKILYYEHWQVNYLGIPAGQLVLNAADQSAGWHPYDDGPVLEEMYRPHSWKWWRRWCIEHETPALS